MSRGSDTRKPAQTQGWRGAAGRGTWRPRCLVAVPEQVVRAGVAATVAAQDVEVAAAVGEWRRAEGVLQRGDVDLVVADPTIAARADWPELFAALGALPGIAVILYVEALPAEDLNAAAAAGCQSVVLKASPASELVRAVRLARAGRSFVDVALIGEILAAHEGDHARVSRREREVLQLLADGHTTERTARAAHLSVATVRSYAEHAGHKLGARNRTHAVAVALRRGLIA